MTRFNAAEVEAGNDAWGCNCGPAAFAAILELTLDETRRYFGTEFEAKRYTNPTLMFAALRGALGNPPARWRVLPGSRAVDASVGWPAYGLARIQWEGRWTQPGVPIAARYRQTHWVGVARRTPAADALDIGIFDVNAIGNGSGWCSLFDWSSKLVPWILESYPGANGRWHVTHAIEVERRPASSPAQGGR